MYTLEDYIRAGEVSPHRVQRTDEAIVKHAIDILVDNLFTGVDLARFIKADPGFIEKAMDKKFFPNGHNVNPKRKNRQA